MASTLSSTDLPAATKLAFDRTRLAYERTMMAWVRTATSLISFGFTIYKFFQYVRQDHPVEGGLGPRAFALLMIGIGLTALVLATVEHRKHMQSLRSEYGTAAYSLSAFVALLVSGLGVIGLVTVLLRQ
jgi:putative membrane protein